MKNKPVIRTIRTDADLKRHMVLRYWKRRLRRLTEAGFAVPYCAPPPLERIRCSLEGHAKVITTSTFTAFQASSPLRHDADYSALLQSDEDP
jgi:hypothetical protein